jgi:hypothetical protein
MFPYTGTLGGFSLILDGMAAVVFFMAVFVSYVHFFGA